MKKSRNSLIGIIRLLCMMILLFGCQTHNQIPIYFEGGSHLFNEVLTHPNHEVQIIYGEIIGDSIRHHKFNVKESRYFYPASTVKMLVAFAAVQKMEEEGLSLQSIIYQDSSHLHQRNIHYDSLFQSPIIFENLLKGIFVLSDNKSYNILYNWLGKDYINDFFAKNNLDTRIVHQLGENAYDFLPESNHSTAKTRMIDSTITPPTEKIFKQEKQNFLSSMTINGEKKGIGFINQEGALVHESFDFSSKNFVSLSTLLECLERVIRPDLFPSNQQSLLSEKSRQKVLNIMSLRPSDLPFENTYPDNYVKFLILGDSSSRSYSKDLIIRNKVGWAYGYLSDIAYVEDKENNIEFFLAASIHVNENNIFNDGIYEYETIGLPFLGELGRLIYQYELQKKSN